MTPFRCSGCRHFLQFKQEFTYNYYYKKEYFYIYTYGRKSVDKILTQSMSKICNLRRLIVVGCDYAESHGRFLSRGNADASHVVYIIPDDS